MDCAGGVSGCIVSEGVGAASGVNLMSMGVRMCVCMRVLYVCMGV